MYRGIFKLALVAVVAAGLIGCGTKNVLEKQLIDQGATRLSGNQVRDHLSGKTQQWDNGGAYFRADGVVYVKWAGKVYPERRWHVEDDGKACIYFPDGMKTSCSVYYDYNGETWVVTLEVFGEQLVVEHPYRYRRDGSIDAGGTVFGGPDKGVDGNRLDEM